MFSGGDSQAIGNPNTAIAILPILRNPENPKPFQQ
jgi:hypothetical protein